MWEKFISLRYRVKTHNGLIIHFEFPNFAFKPKLQFIKTLELLPC